MQYTNISSLFNETGLSKKGDDLLDKLQTASGAEAKKLGQTIDGLNVKEWDKNSSRIMKDLLLESFKQNPNAFAKLLTTGNATLTHTQDKTKWGTEFPKLLMEVRAELKTTQPQVAQTFVETSESPFIESTNASKLTFDSLEESVKENFKKLFISVSSFNAASREVQEQMIKCYGK
jgi:hypothetical protein